MTASAATSIHVVCFMSSPPAAQHPKGQMPACSAKRSLIGQELAMAPKRDIATKEGSARDTSVMRELAHNGNLFLGDLALKRVAQTPR